MYRKVTLKTCSELTCSRFVARKPPVQRLTRHPDLLRSLRHRQPVTNHGHNSLIPLLSHAQLPHLGSVTNQPKQLSRINRNTDAHQPKTKGLQINRSNTPELVGRAGLEPATNGL